MDIFKNLHKLINTNRPDLVDALRQRFDKDYVIPPLLYVDANTEGLNNPFPLILVYNPDVHTQEDYLFDIYIVPKKEDGSELILDESDRTKVYLIHNVKDNEKYVVKMTANSKYERDYNLRIYTLQNELIKNKIDENRRPCIPLHACGEASLPSYKKNLFLCIMSYGVPYPYNLFPIIEQQLDLKKLFFDELYAQFVLFRHDLYWSDQKPEQILFYKNNYVLCDFRGLEKEITLLDIMDIFSCIKIIFLLGIDTSNIDIQIAPLSTDNPICKLFDMYVTYYILDLKSEELKENALKHIKSFSPENMLFEVFNAIIEEFINLIKDTSLINDLLNKMTLMATMATEKNSTISQKINPTHPDNIKQKEQIQNALNGYDEVMPQVIQQAEQSIECMIQNSYDNNESEQPISIATYFSLFESHESQNSEQNINQSTVSNDEEFNVININQSTNYSQK